MDDTSRVATTAGTLVTESLLSSVGAAAFYRVFGADPLHRFSRWP